MRFSTGMILRVVFELLMMVRLSRNSFSHLYFHNRNNSKSHFSWTLLWAVRLGMMSARAFKRRTNHQIKCSELYRRVAAPKKTEHSLQPLHICLQCSNKSDVLDMEHFQNYMSHNLAPLLGVAQTQTFSKL